MALRVLLADDEKEFVETLAERLDLRGIEVRVALDGKAALTTLDEMAAAEALPDVMVVDLLMPGMTGDAVLQQVRRMIREGDLFAVKVGREYRIPEEALAAWLNHTE